MSYKGRKFTEEHKRKLSLAKLGKHLVRSNEGWISFKNKMTGLNNSRWSRIEKICKMCGKSFLVRNYRKDDAIYCSRKCKTDDNLGLTTENERQRKSLEYRLWRKAVFERDKYTCQKCGQIGGYLHAHHIKPYSLFPKLRVDMKNGITLCTDCHKTIHKMIKLAVLNNI